MGYAMFNRRSLQHVGMCRTLLGRMRERFLQAGGTIREHTTVQGAEVCSDGIAVRFATSPAAGLCMTAHACCTCTQVHCLASLFFQKFCTEEGQPLCSAALCLQGQHGMLMRFLESPLALECRVSTSTDAEPISVSDTNRPLATYSQAEASSPAARSSSNGNGRSRPHAASNGAAQVYILPWSSSHDDAVLLALFCRLWLA